MDEQIVIIRNAMRDEVLSLRRKLGNGEITPMQFQSLIKSIELRVQMAVNNGVIDAMKYAAV